MTGQTSPRIPRIYDHLSVILQSNAVDMRPFSDTGGKPEIFRFTVRTLENLGVSAVIIEDKTGLKQNSLFGTVGILLLPPSPHDSNAFYSLTY